MPAADIEVRTLCSGLCDILPVMDVVDLEGLDKNTVYRLDRKWLKRRKNNGKVIRSDILALMKSRFVKVDGMQRSSMIWNVGKCWAW